MAVLDIITLSFIGLYAIGGLYKGLVDSVLSLFNTFISLAISIFLGNRIAEYLRTQFPIDAWVDQFLYDVLKITDHNIRFLNVFEISRDKVAHFLATVVVIVFTYILLLLTIRLIRNLLDPLTDKDSPLQGVNRLLGLAFGTIKGVAVICGFFIIISLVSFVQPIADKLEPLIQETKITKVIYDRTNQFVKDKIKDKIVGDIDSDTSIISLPTTTQPPQAPANYLDNIALLD